MSSREEGKAPKEELDGSLQTSLATSPPTPFKMPCTTQTKELQPTDELISDSGQNCVNRSHREINGQAETGTPSISTYSGRSWASARTEIRKSPMTKIPMLTPISNAEARNRSFLVGSANSWGSLLGAGQLDRHLPDRKLTVFVGTWNTNEISNYASTLEDFLLPDCLEQVPDVYVVGTQENVLSKQDWEVTLQEVIGLSHVLLHSTLFGTLHLGVFARRELIWFCSEPEESTIATRQGSAIKTKGAIGVALQIFGTSFLFINSHLTAHDSNLRERILDYEKIKEGIELPRKIPLKEESETLDVTANFDCVFWFGDLNFRVLCSRKEVLDHLCKPVPELNVLLEADQLKIAMSNKEAFVGFQEEQIQFVPSYKYDVGTDSYDTSEKQRTPAYTDRILFRTKTKTRTSCLHYCSVPTIRMSDHKPVFGVFRVQLRPGRDNIPLAAGQFNRNVYLKVLAKRAASLDPLASQKASRLCTVM